MMLRLLENPNLLEHDTFTDLMLAVFHLHDELACRDQVTDLPEKDLAHLAGDIKRAMQWVVSEWLFYLRHLKEHYPYLYSLEVRKNPFDPEAINSGQGIIDFFTNPKTGAGFLKSISGGFSQDYSFLLTLSIRWWRNSSEVSGYELFAFLWSNGFRNQDLFFQPQLIRGCFFQPLNILSTGRRGQFYLNGIGQT